MTGPPPSLNVGFFAQASVSPTDMIFLAARGYVNAYDKRSGQLIWTCNLKDSGYHRVQLLPNPAQGTLLDFHIAPDSSILALCESDFRPQAASFAQRTGFCTT